MRLWHACPMIGALNIAIVGYGTAGQAAALYLSRAGHRLQIFERSPSLGPVGAGILLQPSGLRVLADLGLFTAAQSCGARIDALYGATIDGRRVMQMQYRDLHPQYFGLGLQRGALFELMRRAYDGTAAIACGIDIQTLASDRRTLIDASGQRHGPFDLVLACDGATSRLRREMTTQKYDTAYPWGALWCLCSDPQRRFQGALWQRYDRARRMAGVLPVGRLPGEPDAEQRVSFFWSLPQSALQQSGNLDLSSWKEEIVNYWPETAALLTSITTVQQLAKANYRDAVLRRFYQDRLVFLGDAAHAMSPQLGQGTNMALLDARELAQALAQERNIEPALAAYNRNRRRHVHVYQLISRWLTPLFQSNYDAAAWWRDRLFYPFSRTPLLRGEMLKVLAGVKCGWFGRLPMSSTSHKR